VIEALRIALRKKNAWGFSIFLIRYK
jgi:hypothetical protein